MTDSAPRSSRLGRRASLSLVIEGGLALRVLAADLVQWITQHRGKRCLFSDADIYWYLAHTIRRGEPYEVSQWGVPHQALRMPGYPLFLAACQALFGDRLLPVRLVQAALGAGTIWLMFHLVRTVWPGPRGTEPEKRSDGLPLLAAALTAFDPFAAGLSVLLLSEAVFVPLMLLGLWGLAALWTTPGVEPTRRPNLIALATGLAMGAAILTRPSWSLFVPAALLVWIAGAGASDRPRAVRGAALIVLGAVVVLAPWWVRNARVFGRFVPTAVWLGASLYDGLNPRATGASDMEFLNEPDLWALDELGQDAELRRRAWAFVRDHPGRALRLAVVKEARFWSPWPNAEMLARPALGWPSALVAVPLLGLIGLGAYDRRRDLRALVLLAGPLAYFAALSAVFVGSIRYRIPGEVPALGLAAVGLRAAWRRLAPPPRPLTVPPQPRPGR